MIKFHCPADNCDGMVKFTFREAEKSSPLKCESCGRVCKLPPEAKEKLKLLENLMKAIRKAGPILGKTSVRVDVDGHGVSIPYYLLLTRLTTEMALDMNQGELKFEFLVDPLETDEDDK